jgi:hypothetical protein
MRPLLALALVAVVATPLSAQRRSDQARISLGVGVGYNGGASMWQVRDQPVNALGTPGNADSVDLLRRARPNIGITFLGAYYPNDRLGFTGEIHLIGLGHEDRCFMRTAPAQTDNNEICTNINGREVRGSATGLTVGAMVRPFPWSAVQPYVRANVGMFTDQHSATEVTATYVEGGGEEVSYTIYRDRDQTTIRPMFALAGGMTAFVGRSYQLRMEVKDNIVPLEEVLGPEPSINAIPESRFRYEHVVSFYIVLEVVLEKRRGRRY